MSINSISPIDGRYYGKVKILSEYFSEKALIKYRIFTEIKYFLALFKSNKAGLRKLLPDEIKLIESILTVSEEDAEIVKKIETTGYNEIPATNHDVKAIEYFIKLKLEKSSVADALEMIHFGLTSEDVNNISYALMIRDAFNRVILPELLSVYEALYRLAADNKNLSMLARTHGQPATPTTFGKEVLVFVSRLKEEFSLLPGIFIYAKLNGATGSFAAHNAAYPAIDWIDFSNSFINGLNKTEDIKYNFCTKAPLELKYNPVTTQIEPHDSYARLFDAQKRINIILTDFCADIWRYISDGWIKQKAVKGEVGSSAMPHKVNPIDFENAEGNLGTANALFGFFTSKLMVSRLQRDLSDSTVLRNIGSAFAHSLLSYKSILKGLTKIEVNKEFILNVLENSTEVLAEAYQSILRAAGVEKPYELLKDMTRGKKVSLKDYHDLVESLNIQDEIKNKLKSLTPSTYTGVAAKIVEGYKPEIY